MKRLLLLMAIIGLVVSTGCRGGGRWNRGGACNNCAGGMPVYNGAAVGTPLQMLPPPTETVVPTVPTVPGN